MICLIEAHGYRFLVEDSWLTELGIKPFSKAGGHYKYLKNDAREVFIVKISDIDPSIRGEGVPIFKEEKAKDILRDLKHDNPLHPIEVEKVNEGKYKFKLYDGCHRLHLSIIVGFDSIPAVLAPEL